jgi:hypothetical protein
MFQAAGAGDVEVGAQTEILLRVSKFIYKGQQ